MTSGQRMRAQITMIGEGPLPVELAITNWLEVRGKARGSKKTFVTYSDIIQKARDELLRLGLDFDSDTDAVGIALEAWARRRKDGGGDVAPNTYKTRLAVLDSFYKFVRRHRFLHCDNPIVSVGRESFPSAVERTVPLNLASLRKQLAAIDQSDLAGLRDYALVLLALHTGRRASELASLRWGHLRHSGDTLTITWPHVKGNTGSVQDTVYGPVRAALLRYLHTVHGLGLATLPSDTPLWVAMDFYAQSRVTERTISVQGLEAIMSRRIGTSKMNVTRTTMGVPLPASVVAQQEMTQANHELVPGATDIYLAASLRR